MISKNTIEVAIWIRFTTSCVNIGKEAGQVFNIIPLEDNTGIIRPKAWYAEP